MWARPAPSVWSCRSRAASWPCPTSRGPGGEATDFAVAQPVVDEREEMARRRDTADVATPAGADTRLHRGDLRVAHRAGDGFHGGPAQQAGSLLGDVAALDVGVGLAVARGEPGPRAQMAGAVEPMDVSDLGNEHGAEHGADAAQRLDRVVAGVAAQAAVGPGVAVADLTVIQVDQFAQRDDTLQVGVTERKIIEPTRAVTTKDVVELGDHPFFAEGLVDLRFQPGAEPAQLGPIADHLAQLPQRWRGHPRLR